MLAVKFLAFFDSPTVPILHKFFNLLFLFFFFRNGVSLYDLVLWMAI